MNETKCPNCGWSKTYEIDKSNSYNLLIEVSNENERLAQQLQAYKQKEDKIKEYCKETPIPFKDEVNKWAEDGRTWAKDAILQILNEGGKECL